MEVRATDAALEHVHEFFALMPNQFAKLRHSARADAGEDGHHAFTAQKSSPQRRICLYSGHNNLQGINSHAPQPESPAAMRRIWLHWAVYSAREQLGAIAVAMRIGGTRYINFKQSVQDGTDFAR